LKNAGLPFAFHPKWVQIVKTPQDKVLIRNCFEEFYAEELAMIDGLLSYIEFGNFEEISSFEFASPSEWYLTSEYGIRNFMNFRVQDVNRSKPKEPSPLKTGQDIVGFFRMIFNVQETNQIEHRPTFQPKTAQDVIEFVKMAKNRAYSVFKDNIASFMEGLSIYIKTDLICWVKTPILLNIFSPLPEIDVDVLLDAFNFDSGEGLHVQVSNEDLCDIDVDIVVMSSSDPDSPLCISAKDAFKIAVKRLQPMSLLPGILGQLTGSRSVSFRQLKPDMFEVKFYEIAGSRPLFGDGPSSSENVQLPIASSWYI
jgi:hypothetical protein